jgi:hypothetical protein
MAKWKSSAASAHAAGMLLVAGDNLGAGLEVQPVGHEIHALGGVLGERDLFHVGADQARRLRADADIRRVARNPVLAAVIPVGDVGGDLAHVLDGPVEHDLRHRPERAGVEEDFVPRQQELIADLVPIFGIFRRGQRRSLPRPVAREEPDGQGGGNRFQETAASVHGRCSFGTQVYQIRMEE